jgi:cytoskeletal protein RodZ
LKKLDEDSMDGDSQAGEQKIKIRRVVHRRTKTPRSIYRFRSISLVLSLLVIAVLVAWVLIDTTPPPHTVTKSPQHQQVSTLKKERESQPQKTPQKAPEEIKTPKNKKKIEAVITPVPKTPTQKTNKVIEAVEKKSKHPEFILSGVLWSNTPGKRVALINGRYVKEGDEISGVSVVRIEKKMVTLQSGEETWTIRLKR